MNMILKLHKPIGKTPLDVIKDYKRQHPDQKDVPMTYAGRLDPMAEGLLLILTGEDVHRKDEFLGLDKTYKAQILLGASTDTGDILGVVIEHAPVGAVKDFDPRFLLGDHEMVIPSYSAYKVNGKPLWRYARSGELVPEIKKDMTVRSVEYLNNQTVSIEDIVSRVERIEGDFRQDEIIKKWRSFPYKKYRTIALKLEVSAGTYIRSLAALVGEELGVPATLYALDRTAIG